MCDKEYSPPLDEGIKQYVVLLNKYNIETYESCEGGDGHAYAEPTICFHGERSEGFRALAVLLQYNTPISSLKRKWDIIDGEPTGPTWELVMYLRK